jgi:hypothetical protein
VTMSRWTSWLIPSFRRRRTFRRCQGKRGQRTAAASDCHGSGAGAGSCVGRTVPQGHNVSLLDVLQLRSEMREHRWCLLVLELNGYYM